MKTKILTLLIIIAFIGCCNKNKQSSDNDRLSYNEHKKEEKNIYGEIKGNEKRYGEVLIYSGGKLIYKICATKTGCKNGYCSWYIGDTNYKSIAEVIINRSRRMTKNECEEKLKEYK